MISSIESDKKLVSDIREKQWWQGSVVRSECLPECQQIFPEVEWWIILSQTCNIYNLSFKNVPVVEVVAAKRIPNCDAGKIKGDNPRILHVKGFPCPLLGGASREAAAFEIDIQKRCWLPREILAQIPPPSYGIFNTIQVDGQPVAQIAWQDNFIGWVARSYTRVTLPDEFNAAMQRSKIKNVLEDKLSRRKDDLYGVYLRIDPDTEEEWVGNLGEMRPPYLLGIRLVTYDHADTSKIKEEIVRQIFEDVVQDPEDVKKKISRADLAERNGIRIIEASIDVTNTTGTSISDLIGMTRYTFIDHLSDSSLASRT